MNKQSAAPKLFVNDTYNNAALPASAFITTVGRQIFGSLWTDSDIHSSPHPNEAAFSSQFVGDSSIANHRKMFAQTRIIEFLADGEIAAEISLPAINWEAICRKAWANDPRFKAYLSSKKSMRFEDVSPDTLAESVVTEWENAAKLPKTKLMTDYSLGMSEYADEETDDNHAEEAREIESAEINASHEVRVNAVKSSIQTFLSAHQNVKRADLTITIEPKFWEQLLLKSSSSEIENSIDWRNSLLKIEGQYIQLKRGSVKRRAKRATWGRLERLAIAALESHLRNLSSPFAFSIRFPHDALAVLAREPDYLRENAWATEVMNSKSYFWPLIVASVWRVLAFKLNKMQIEPGQAEVPHGVRDQVMLAVQDYLELKHEAEDTGSGELVSSAALRPVIAKICDQLWRGQDNSDIMIGLTAGMSPRLRSLPKKARGS